MERAATIIMETGKDDEKKKIVFTDVEDDQEKEMELQMKALACGMHRGGAVTRPGETDDKSTEDGEPQQPFWGYRYMTPIELEDDAPVTSWTIIRTFEDDTGVHGIEHIGRAIGKLNQFESFRHI